MRHLKKSWNQWKSIGPASVSQIFFRSLNLDCFNISIYKKGKVKDEASQKIREINGGQIKWPSTSHSVKSGTGNFFWMWLHGTRRCLWIIQTIQKSLFDIGTPVALGTAVAVRQYHFFRTLTFWSWYLQMAVVHSIFELGLWNFWFWKYLTATKSTLLCNVLICLLKNRVI